MIFCLYKKRMQCFQMCLLPFLYFGTMLLGPVVQVRYLFPIIVLLPVMTAMFSSRLVDEERGNGTHRATETTINTKAA